GARPITDAIGIAAQKRTAACDALRRIRGHIAIIRVIAVRWAGRIQWRLTILRLDRERIGAIPVCRPLPYIARHVIQAVAVSRKAAHRGRTDLNFFVLAHRKRLLLLGVPDIGHGLALRAELITPAIVGLRYSSTRGKFPFSLSRQS